MKYAFLTACLKTELQSIGPSVYTRAVTVELLINITYAVIHRLLH